MVGGVVLTYGFIARELIATAEYIVGKIEGIAAVSIRFNMDALRERIMISQAIHQVDQGEGVLIMTDFSGGISYNRAFSFLKTDEVEVITGVNLPMILTFWNMRESRKMIELAKDLQLSGTRSIAVARNLMEERAAVPTAVMDVSKNV